MKIHKLQRDWGVVEIRAKVNLCALQVVSSSSWKKVRKHCKATNPWVLPFHQLSTFCMLNSDERLLLASLAIKTIQAFFAKDKYYLRWKRALRVWAEKYSALQRCLPIVSTSLVLNAWGTFFTGGKISFWHYMLCLPIKMWLAELKSDWLNTVKISTCLKCENTVLLQAFSNDT